MLPWTTLPAKDLDNFASLATRSNSTWLRHRVLADAVVADDLEDPRQFLSGSCPADLIR